MIVRIKMNGDFSDEAGGVDLSTECCLKDVELVAQCAADYEAERIRTRVEVVADWHQQVTRMLINDLQYNSFDAFVQLEKELISYIDTNFDNEDVGE